MGCKASKAVSSQEPEKCLGDDNISNDSSSYNKKKKKSKSKSPEPGIRGQKSSKSTDPGSTVVEHVTPLDDDDDDDNYDGSNRVVAEDEHGSNRDGYTETYTNNNDDEDESSDCVYKLLTQAQQDPDVDFDAQSILHAVSPASAAYRNRETRSTPLHVAIRLLDSSSSSTGPSREGIADVLDRLIQACPESVYAEDASGNFPLHYAIAPFVGNSAQLDKIPSSAWKKRTEALRLLLIADKRGMSSHYLHRNDVVYDSDDATGRTSPLYRGLQTLPDDFEIPSATVEFMMILTRASVSGSHSMVGVGNASDGDKPLALLYRRFTRQFDLAEKFFSGDNSRPEVVEHRRRYKTAAGNTWRIIEILLKTQPENEDVVTYRTVHRAVQIETPPDLLRYIVETNAEDLTVADTDGNLPLHYAAMSRPPVTRDYKMSFPSFYSKYVIDELLYKFPEASSKPNARGLYPLTLAAQAGKQWIGGGIKSLYDAYPEALQQLNVEENKTLRHVLSMDTLETFGTPREARQMEIIEDEPHDAIMLVQQGTADVSEVVTSMWAHEEDAGVQMLGCVALARMTMEVLSDLVEVERISLSSVPAVVNAMKAHPNEVIVQEKACRALKTMASSDGKREVSFVASGAVAAIVGAMQAHVSDPGVQEEACAAVTEIIRHGGADRATIVASVSGLTAIVNSVAAHPTVQGVQRDGCRALCELTTFSKTANLPDIPRTQVEPLLLSAKNKFPNDCKSSVEILLPRLS